MTYYCEHCGYKIQKGQKYCPKCGTKIDRSNYDFVDKDEFESDLEREKSRDRDSQRPRTREYEERESDYELIVNVTKAFMIAITVLSGIAVIPLLWTIPMTMHYFKAIDNDEKLSIPFKVCSLIFVGLVPGILMFVDKYH